MLVYLSLSNNHTTNKVDKDLQHSYKYFYLGKLQYRYVYKLEHMILTDYSGRMEIA